MESALLAMAIILISLLCSVFLVLASVRSSQISKEEENDTNT